MDPIGSFSGLASGIQWRDLVDQIVALDASRKVTPLTRQIITQNQRREAWNGFKGLLSNLKSATTPLRDGSAFGEFTVSVGTSSTSGKTLFSASATSTAAPGSYNVEVVRLATNEKLAGGKVADTAADLNLAGTFHVNGNAVTLETTDSLEQVRDKINAVNAGTNPSGVTATILSTSATEHQLVLTADNTGTKGIELIDSGGATKVLQGLGIHTADPTVANTSADGLEHQTQRFESRTTAVAQMLGLSSPPATANIVVDGVKVAVDLQNDSLDDVLTSIKDALNAAGKTATADATKIVTEEVGGQTLHRLTTTGAVSVEMDANGVPIADSQRALELLGFQKGVRSNEIQAGANSEINIDGFNIQRRTNTISDALEGITLTLEGAAAGETSTLTVGRDLDAAVDQVKKLADAYNSMIAFYDKQRQPGQPLYANGALRSMVSSVKDVLLSKVVGLDPANPYNRTAIAGVALTRDGTLEVDAERLKSALQTNLNDVKALFNTSGSATHADVSFVNGTSDTAAGTYAVSITQAATVASAQSSGFSGTYLDDGVNANTITLTDAYTGGTGSITLVNGDTTTDIAAKLNDMFSAQGMTLSARDSGGELVIEGSKYGSAASFTLEYSRNGAAATPQAGLMAAGTYAGLDVAGTINGEAATGSGQLLTGADGTTADGLSVLYKGTATGAMGEVTYTLGVAGMMERVADTLSRASTGSIDLQVKSIDNSIQRLESREEDANFRLELRRESLIRQFTAMEEAMGRIQAQGNWLASQIKALGSLSYGGQR